MNPPPGTCLDPAWRGKWRGLWGQWGDSSPGTRQKCSGGRSARPAAISAQGRRLHSPSMLGPSVAAGNHRPERRRVVSPAGLHGKAGSHGVGPTTQTPGLTGPLRLSSCSLLPSPLSVSLLSFPPLPFLLFFSLPFSLCPFLFCIH